MQAFEGLASGGTLHSVKSIALNLNKFSPLSASKFLELSADIKNKRAIINVKNTDNECFYYALVSVFYPANRHKELPSSYPQNFNQLFNCGDIRSPVKIKDISKFERLNRYISINVYGLKENKVIGPLYHTKCKKTKHANLLYIRKNKVSHYCAITSMSRLCRSSFSKHKGRTYICDRCLRYFWSEQKLENHDKDCSNFEAVRIEFMKPEKNTLFFKNLNFNLRHPFVIYADLECLTIPYNVEMSNLLSRAIAS